MELSGDGSITLDRKAFKALASETRVEILKKLDGTQKTVSDLAREMDMNKATMFEHLEQLVEVGLVRKDTEAERATTVKTAPFEAPVLGPPKKWVYYRLTWKGKNVLHPERVKIAILLSVTALVLALAGLLFLATLSSVPSPGPGIGDTSPPLVVDWHLETVRLGAGVNLSLAAADNSTGKPSGLDIERSELVWGVARQADSIKPDVLDWSDLAFTSSGDTLSATVPQNDWGAFNGNHLLVGVHLFDRAGNSAWYFNSELVRAIAGADLRIVPGTISMYSASSGTRPPFILRALVENAGSGDAVNVSVGLYLQDPDPGRTGRASSSALDTASLGALPAGASRTVELRLESQTLKPGRVYLMVDPGNSVPEADKGNNVDSMLIPDKFAQKPAAGMAPGFEFAAVLLALVAVIMLGDRLRNGGCRD